MALEDPLDRLLLLQRDLIAFSENRLPRLDRLRYQLDASADDLKRLLDRKKRNDTSRKVLLPDTTPPPTTLKIDDVEYTIRPEFRQCALQVADELNLDEIEAAKLCISAQPTGLDGQQSTQVFCALLRFHEQRRALLDCLRRLLQLGTDLDSDDERIDGFRDVVRLLIRGERGGQSESSSYWRRCLEGLQDVEGYLKKLNEHKQMIVMTGQTLSETADEALYAERLLLAEQHESLSAVLSYLIRGSFAQAEDFRSFLTHAASLEADADITIHYLPIIISGAAHFAADGTTSLDASNDLHKVFAAGPGQLQWKQPNLKAAATVFWLAEYNSRFTGLADADSRAGEPARLKLFYDALVDKAFHYILSGVAFLKPVVWYDPSRMAITEFLIDSVGLIPPHTPRASDEFALFALREIQVFSDAFITNMPDVLRKLKQDEDDKRRHALPQDLGNAHQAELGLERFMVIMAFAYDGDADAARDFWSDRESNLYGFLRWASQRLPTPRVAAFCQLLRSIACDAQSANHVHRFLLEDVATTSGRSRKAHAVSWAQIFNELEVFAASVSPKDKDQASYIDEPETGIMLDAYLGLTAHICRASPDARNWLLRDQPFHLGDVMFKLANSNTLARVQACCLDVLSALLADNLLEVRNGTWVLLDSWNPASSTQEKAVVPATSGSKQPESAKQYLQMFAKHSEVAASLVRLLDALVSPLADDSLFFLGGLPFPENLGAPFRIAGIDIYVDFVLDSIFARRIPQMLLEGEESLVDVTRFNCLDFAYTCLSTFDEDLVLLANTSAVGIESAMETKSLNTYVRLHPFARVMEWFFDKNVMESLFATLRRHFEFLNSAPPGSPLVQSTLRSIQVLNLAWKLQPTYNDIVRPLLATSASRPPVRSNTAFNSIDEILLSHLDAIVDIATYMTTRHVDIALESIALLHKICASRLLSREPDTISNRSRHGTRLAGLLSGAAPTLTMQLCQDFVVESWDLETEGVPLKLVKAGAVLDLLIASLNTSGERLGVAHILLGFDCTDGSVRILPDTAISEGKALFNGIVQCAAQLPGAIDGNNISWLLGTKRACLKVIDKLVNTASTSNLVQTQLRRIDFQPAFAYTQAPATLVPIWDGKDIQDPSLLLDESASAVRNYIYVRAAYFELSAADLRSAAEQRLYSVQEKIVAMLLGTSTANTNGFPQPTSILELFDFYELETCAAFEANCAYLKDVDMSPCIKDDADGAAMYDIKMAEELLTLRKRELSQNATLKDVPEQQIDDEIGAIIASLTSWNNWSSLQSARLYGLEAWTDLLSLVITSGGLKPKASVSLALQTLLVVLPKLERALSESLDAAALLCKLTLTLTSAISAASREESKQTANVAIERLLSSFRVSLKAITDSNTDSVIRDVCYRIGCAVLAAFPPDVPTAQTPPSASIKQLINLIQNAGERLLAVVTEDGFSGRGVTRVSALLFVDGLLSLYQPTKQSPYLLRALTKLNFVPVLIDSSLGNVAAVFAPEDESVTTLAYFHSALALLLRLCQSAEGAQLVLNAGFADAVADSRLFSTDPDIGLDIDNPAALREFYRILAAVLRVLTAVAVVRGPAFGLAFLQTNRWSMMAVFKKSSGSAVDRADEVREVAVEFSRLVLATGFLEDDAPEKDAKLNGFT